MNRRRAALAIGCALLVASCGVPLEDRTQTIANQDVPFQLLNTTTTTTNTTSTTVLESGPSTTVPAKEQVPLFFVRNDRVELVTREVSSALGVEDRLRLLTEQLPAAEAAEGFRSALAPGAVADANFAGGIALVDLSAAFTEVPPLEQVLAFAQMTYTLTALPGIGLVEFTLNGQRVQVLDDEGTLIEGPVSRVTYENLYASD
jgi:spore germination protein GerM